MQEVYFYFMMGILHILTWEAADHLLFIAALSLNFVLTDWRKVLGVVTCFTIGHAITLAMTAFGFLDVPVKWIEFLVPVTISCTALANLLRISKGQTKAPVIIFLLALFFGLIHGMAFASSFSMLDGGENLGMHLFAFNTGVECAQLLVVIIVLSLSFLIMRYVQLSHIAWLRVASVFIFLLSLNMCWERFPSLH